MISLRCGTLGSQTQHANNATEHGTLEQEGDAIDAMEDGKSQQEGELSNAAEDGKSENNEETPTPARDIVSSNKFDYLLEKQDFYFKSAQEKWKKISNPEGRQSSLIILLSKCCDVVLECIMGFFFTFRECWEMILISFKDLIFRFIDFLETIVHALTDDNAIKFTSAAAVSVLAIACAMLYIALAVI